MGGDTESIHGSAQLCTYKHNLFILSLLLVSKCNLFKGLSVSKGVGLSYRVGTSLFLCIAYLHERVSPQTPNMVQAGLFTTTT
jgi:hypothetical protein